MKRILFLICMLFTIPALSADLKLAWDSAPNWEADTTVRIYETTSGSPVKVGEVPAAGLQISLPSVVPGIHKYVARAYSPMWQAESDDSNEVSTPAMPDIPKNLKFSITITVGN